MSKADDLPTDPEQRVFTRVPFVARVTLDLLTDTHACALVDVSLKGALVERGEPWRTTVGAPCALTVELSEGHDAIHMKGTVAHVEAGRLGLHCAEIDLESMVRLRRLVELNLGDEDTLNRELGAMVRPRGEV